MTIESLQRAAALVGGNCGLSWPKKGAEMSPTKDFNELVQSRLAKDPEFAVALLREAAVSPPLTRRDALRQIWVAAKYPIRGNEDWRTAARMDAEALERAGKAVSAPGDPPEFAMWIAALRDPRTPDIEREDIMSAIYDLFGSEDGNGGE